MISYIYILVRCGRLQPVVSFFLTGWSSHYEYTNDTTSLVNWQTLQTCHNMPEPGRFWHIMACLQGDYHLFVIHMWFQGFTLIYPVVFAYCIRRFTALTNIPRGLYGNCRDLLLGYVFIATQTATAFNTVCEDVQHTLKQNSCHGQNFGIDGWTGGCQCDQSLSKLMFYSPLCFSYHLRGHQN